MYENLKLGSFGDSVKILQEKLKILGFYNALITGSFGLSTEVGVKAFQKKVGIEESGIVDNATWEKINEYTSSVAPISNYPTLSIGSTGNYVTDLQLKLKSLLYYTGDVNGNFDLETQNAVKRFQLNNSLTSDGIVGSKTWNLINSLYGNLSDCVVNNEEENDNLTYTVVAGDKIFMGNNEVYKESLKEVLFKCKIIFYLSAKIALKMFTYYYRNDIIVV